MLLMKLSNIKSLQLTFNGLQNSYTNYDSHTFKQNEVFV